MSSYGGPAAHVSDGGERFNFEHMYGRSGATRFAGTPTVLSLT
jgi:hypothetical protein